MKNIYKTLLLFMLLLSLTMALAACGRYSAPYPVEGSGFPHNYPRGQE